MAAGDLSRRSGSAGRRCARRACGRREVHAASSGRRSPRCRWAARCWWPGSGRVGCHSAVLARSRRRRRASAPRRVSGCRSARSMGLPSSSTISTCSMSHPRAFAFRMSERTAGIWSARSSCCRRSARASCCMRSASWAISASMSSSVTSSCLGLGERPQGEVGLDGVGGGRPAGRRRAAAAPWPVASRYCWMVAPWASSRWARSWRRRSISAVHERRRGPRPRRARPAPSRPRRARPCWPAPS